MASEAKLDFSSNTTEAQASIDKLVKKTAQLTEQLRKMKDESKNGTKEAATGHEQLISTIGSTAAKVTSLGVLIGDVYGSWSSRLDELKNKHKDFLPTMGKGLAEGGRLEQAPAVQQWLGKMQESGITRDHAMQALAGATAAGELTPSEQKDVAGEAAKFGKTGMDVKAFGGMMAELKKIAPDMSPEDLADTGLSLKKQLGDKASVIGSDAFQRQMAGLKEAGITGKDAITYAGLAMGADKKGNALELLTKKGLTAEERKDKKRIFNPTDFENMGGELEIDRQTNFAAKQLAATPGGLRSANAAALAKDRSSAKLGPGQTALANVQDATQEGSRGMQQALDPIFRKIDAISRFLGLETAGGQAKSLAAAGVRAGKMTEGDAGALLAELQKQTQLMERERRPVNVDAHTE